MLIITATSVLAQKVIKVDSSHVMTLRVDPSNASGGNVSDVFAEVNYIPLETTDESLFGSIGKLEVTDDYFIILDHNTHCILIFTKTGKFHAKIKSTEGKNMIYDFAINKFTKQITFSRDGYKNMTTCDYDGKVIKTTKLGGETAKDEINSDNLIYFAPDKAIGTYYYNEMDSTDKYYKTFSKSLILYADNKHKVYAHGLPFKKAESKLGNEILYAGNSTQNITNAGIDTVFFYSKAYNYSIFTITPNTIKYAYQLIFPLYASLPIDFSVNPIYKEKRIEYIEKHRDAIFSLTNVFQSGDNLFFKASIYGTTKEDNLIYNLKSGNLIAYKHIQPDEKSFYLPISEDNWNFAGMLTNTGGYLYTAVSSLATFTAYEQNKDNKDVRNLHYNPVLTQYFKKGNRKDNPCIIQLKLKNDL
ncbi:MAG: 6-bladed beta-propeller protein [Mucilaginibacter sp.]|nr:6-bladed beta-propeller protein [Mucilaginibacter sp.]